MNSLRSHLLKGSTRYTPSQLIQLVNDVNTTMSDIKIISELNSKLKYQQVNNEIARFTLKRLNIMNVSLLASITSSLSRSEYFDKQYYKKASENFLFRLRESNTIDASTMCHAFSLLPPPPFRNLFTAVGDYLTEESLIKELSARNSAHLLNSYSRVNIHHFKLFAKSLPIGNLEIHHSTIVLNAMAKFLISDRIAINNLLEHIKFDLKNLKIENLANAIHALAKLNHATPLVKEFSNMFLSLLPDFGIREMSNCLWGLSKLKALDLNMYLKCFELIEKNNNEVIKDEKSVAQIMEALRRLNSNGENKVDSNVVKRTVETLVTPLVERIGALSVPVITQISWCLVDLGVKHEFIEKSFKEFETREIDKNGTEWAFVQLLKRSLLSKRLTSLDRDKRRYPEEQEDTI